MNMIIAIIIAMQDPPPLFSTLKIFQVSPAERGEGHCVWFQTSTSLVFTLLPCSPFSLKFVQFPESSKSFHKSERSIMSLAFTVMSVIDICYMLVINCIIRGGPTTSLQMGCVCVCVCMYVYVRVCV